MGKKYFTYYLSLFACLILFGVFVSSIDASLWVDETSTSFSSGLNQLNASYEFLEPVAVTNDGIVSVYIDGLQDRMVVGEPILPMRMANILLPSNKEVLSVEVIYSKGELLATGSPGIADFPIQINEDYGEAPTLEGNLLSGVYPENLTEWTVGKVKGESILSLPLYPVQYNSDTGEFLFYNTIDVVVNFDKDEVYQTLSVSLKNTDDEFVSSFVDNPERTISDSRNMVAQSFDSMSGDSYNYVIITSENLSNYDGEYNFQALLNQKQNRVANQLGGQIVTKESILANSTFYCDGPYGDGCSISSFNDTAAIIRNFIKYANENWGTIYVLLGGDVAIIPVRSFYINLYRSDVSPTYIPSDMYYANLDGSMNANNDSYWGWTGDNVDFLSDVYVGRAPVETYEQLSNFVRKTILYENLTINRDSFTKNALSVYDVSISDLSVPTDYLRVHDYSVYSTNPYIYSTWIADYINSKSANDSPAIINSAGHGSQTWLSAYGSFSNTKNSYPNFFYSQACWVGWFDYSSDSFAEQLVYSQNSSYAALMNSRYGWYLPNNPSSGPGNVFMNEFWYQVLYNDVRGIAQANQMSKYAKLYYYGSYSKWLYWTQNLLGDPEISIYFYPNQIHFAISIKSPVENYYYNNESVLVNITCTNCSSVWWSDGSINYSSPVIFNFSEGNNSIYVYANDSFGTLDSTNVSFFIDLEQPTINVSNIGGEYRRQTVVDFNFSFSDNYGIAQEFVETDLSGEFVNYTKNNMTGVYSTSSDSLIDVVLATNVSNFSYRFHATDYAGNINSTDLQTVEILNSPPVFNNSFSNMTLFVYANKTLSKSLLFSDIDFDEMNISVVSGESLVFVEDDEQINISSLDNAPGRVEINISANDSVDVVYAKMEILVYGPEWETSTAGFEGETTNLTELNSFIDIPVILENPSLGKINFAGVNLTEPYINLSRYVSITNKRIFVNSTALSSFNVPATLNFYGISDSFPIVYRDNVICSSGYCSAALFNSSSRILVVNVTGFSTYEVKPASCSDGIQDGYETGIDCGGSCSSCSIPASSGGGGGGGSARNYDIGDGNKKVEYVSIESLNIAKTIKIDADDRIVFLGEKNDSLSIVSLNKSLIVFNTGLLYNKSLTMNETKTLIISGRSINITYANYSFGKIRLSLLDAESNLLVPVPATENVDELDIVPVSIEKMSNFLEDNFLLVILLVLIILLIISKEKKIKWIRE